MEGNRSNNCLLALFGSQETSDILQIDFSFSDGQTTASGKGRLVTLDELRQLDEGESIPPSVGVLRWDIPSGSAILATDPPSEAVSDLSPNSVSEIIEFSRDRPDLIFQVVTLQLLS